MMTHDMPIAPVEESKRIHAIDAVRGFALLGILFVNVLYYSQPFATATRTHAPASAALIDKVAFSFIHILCESKFYPLFSMLFGMGLTLQSQRADAGGRRFFAFGLRRLGILAIIGLLHAAFIWYGDVLFFYAVAGVPLLILRRARPRTLFICAGVTLLLSIVMTTILAFSDDTTSGATSQPAATTQQILQANDPYDARWIALERDAYQHGPYELANRVRVRTWFVIVYVTIMGFGWHIATMFLLGAALFKMDLFESRRRDWHKRFIWIGVIGLLISAARVLAPRSTPPIVGTIGFIAGAVTDPLLSFGYLGAITLLVQSGRAKSLVRIFSSAGRMALTNYILQSVLATAIFYHWGLGKFGTLSFAALIPIVIAIYGINATTSILWLRRFRYGPLEWLWRSLTYLKVQPMR